MISILVRQHDDFFFSLQKPKKNLRILRVFFLFLLRSVFPSVLFFLFVFSTNDLFDRKCFLRRDRMDTNKIIEWWTMRPTSLQKPQINFKL